MPSAKCDQHQHLNHKIGRTTSQTRQQLDMATCHSLQHDLQRESTVDEMEVYLTSLGTQIIKVTLSKIGWMKLLRKITN